MFQKDFADLLARLGFLTAALKQTLYDELTQRGITSVCDDDIEMCCEMFDNGEGFVIAAEARFDPRKRTLSLIEQDDEFNYCGTDDFDILCREHADSAIAVFRWFATIFSGLDGGAYRIVDGCVTKKR